MNDHITLITCLIQAINISSTGLPNYSHDIYRIQCLYHDYLSSWTSKVHQWHIFKGMHYKYECKKIIHVGHHMLAL